jgi:hypothetical protein
VPPVPPVPGLQYQVESYAAKVKTLSIFWFVYAAVSLAFGMAGLAFARAFIGSHFGNWGGHEAWPSGPPPEWFGPIIIRFAWMYLLVRTGLAVAAGWALMERSRSGRIIAIVAAIFCILKFPFGTALGIWTLVLLLGYRNTVLYEQLP